MEADMRVHLCFSRQLFILLMLVLTLTPALAIAGGPLDVCRPGVPFRWPAGGTNIPWNPDLGNLGPLDNAGAVELLATAFSRWGAIPTASTAYVNAGPLPIDVDVTNFGPYLSPDAPDGASAVVFDDTGEIFDLLFGPGSGVLGFAGPEWLDTATCEIAEGVSFLNGPVFISPGTALDIIVHELGHYQNLAHTVVNGQIAFGDHSGPTPFDTFPIDTLIGRIETMYPFYFGATAGSSTPDRDDVAALSTLYPEPTFASTTGTISGRILASNGTTPKTGFNVIARNVADPLVDAVSAISSDATNDYTPGAPFVGAYTLRGLTPGAQYAVFVDSILQGGFSTPPGILPGPEEFYNGASEGNTASIDPPDQFTAVSAAAGATTTGIDIVFNGFVPGEPLPLTDDSSVEVALPFGFWMCGRRYDEVIVNANGTVSFGALNDDFSESAAEFLAGPPQIAGVWDDLNPSAGGTVSFTQSPSRFTVTFEGVPERAFGGGGTGSNTFSITLKRFLSQIDVRYGELSAQDGLAGVSCGGAIASGFEEPSDLSRLASHFRINLLFQPAVYEAFTAPTPTSPGSPNDLANLTLRYTPTTDYSDFWSEPNDTLQRATRIDLPFSSIPLFHFTEIGRPGDVDVYRFRARAGQIIVAEILTSQLDTVMGLFNRATGELLAVDDDSGAGPLSRIQFTIPEDGEYAVAISTFPDFGFSRSSGAVGRYVLQVGVAPETTTSQP
jgi:hypothetical protein